MIVTLLTEQHLRFLSLKGGCRGSSESTLFKMSNCWKSHAAAQMYISNKVSLIFSNICCWYTLESPPRGNSNGHLQHMSIQ